MRYLSIFLAFVFATAAYGEEAALDAWRAWAAPYSASIEVPICNSPLADISVAKCMDPGTVFNSGLSEAIGADALSCKWGCCSSSTVAKIFQAEEMFDVALAKLPENIQPTLIDYRARILPVIDTPEGDDLIERAKADLNASGFCIFCCTF